MKGTMSTLASPIKAINELRIHQLPAGKAVKVAKAIRYDGKTFILGVDGTVYCSAVMNRAFYPLSAWGWATSMVRALVRLGALSKKDAETHLAAAAKVDTTRELKQCAAGLVSYAEDLGLRFTKKQERYIQAIRSGK